MKARLNIFGQKLEVVSIAYYNDQIVCVSVLNADNKIETYYDSMSKVNLDRTLKADINKLIEYPAVEEKIEEMNSKLIEHLEEVYDEEQGKLTDIAIDAMEDETELPFNIHLSDKQREYKLQQQRVFGIIDTIEEVKAFQEGWFNEQITEEVK